MSTQTYNENKLRALVLHISSALRDDPAFGQVKLNKALFFADFAAYDELGQSITGVNYIKLDHGPVASTLSDLERAMQQNEEIELTTQSYYGQQQKRVEPNTAADLSVFSKAEIALVDTVIEVLRPLNASQLSNLTHKFRGWKIADTGERIPYETVFLACQGATQADKARARELAGQLGW